LLKTAFFEDKMTTKKQIIPPDTTFPTHYTKPQSSATK